MNLRTKNRMSDAYDLTEQLPVHYAKAAFGGAVCCSVTDRGTTPVVVIKTQMQLEPAKFTSFFSADKNITSAEGSGALAKGGQTPKATSCRVGSSSVKWRYVRPGSRWE